MLRASYLSDLNAAAAWAGITAFVWYAFGTVPLHIGVSQQLGLTTAQTSSWIFVVWFSGAIATIWLSLQFRQPLPITWTLPGLVGFVVAATPFAILGITSAFWAIIAGLAASALVERQQLFDYWRNRGEGQG